MKTKLLAMLLMALFSVTIYSQKETLSGRVTDAYSGEPLANATVQVNNSSVFAITADDGTFTITAKTGDILVVSHINYYQLSVTAVPGENIIKMVSKTIDLENITVKADPLRDISISAVVTDSVKAVVIVFIYMLVL